MLKLSSVLVLALLGGIGVSQTPHFEMVHQGAHWTWYARSDQFDEHRASYEAMYDYMDRAYDALVAAWGFTPKEQHRNILIWEKTGGGFATGDIGEIHAITGKTSPGIACSYDGFYGNAHGITGYWAMAILTHEMVNSFTGEIVSAGWPRDWWADDRSPFPYVTSVELEFKLAPQVGVYHLAEDEKDPQIQMFLQMKDQYGWRMFRLAFQTAIDDGINWDRFDGNPSPLRTNYVAAYLEMGAGEDLSKLMTGPVPNYDHATVLAIIRARRRWLGHPKGSEEYQAGREAYLSGHYQGVR